MRLVPICLAMTLLASSFPAAAQLNRLQIVPASPVALELVHADIDLNNCDDARGVELMDGGLRVLVHVDDRNPFTCDSVGRERITLGAFAPGSYRVEVRLSFETGAAAVAGDVAQFVVAPGPASTIPNDDNPREDLSGVWTSPTEPSTGLFLVHSAGELAPTASGTRPRDLLTGFWAVFEPSGAPVWYILQTERTFSGGNFVGTVVRYTASGAGVSRLVTPSTIGTVRISASGSGKRVMATLGGQELDFAIEPLRWTRAAWPGAAPDNF